jgi:hypothetical protein
MQMMEGEEIRLIQDFHQPTYPEPVRPEIPIALGSVGNDWKHWWASNVFYRVTDHDTVTDHLHIVKFPAQNIIPHLLPEPDNNWWIASNPHILPLYILDLVAICILPRCVK